VTTTVGDILDVLNSIAPAELAEAWDNVGLMLGGLDEEVRGIVLGLDPVDGLLDEAIGKGANLVVTHHPAIFRPLKKIDIGEPEGAFIARSLRENINIISCHTNLDSAAGGVNDVLAASLGLQDIRPLVPNSASTERGIGMGRIGEYDPPITGEQFITALKKACGLELVLSAGKPVSEVRSVALCGGSGSDLAVIAKRAGAQVFVTSEVKHSVACWAGQANFWILDAGHFATENPVVSFLAGSLQQKMAEKGMEPPVWQYGQSAPLQLI